MSRGVVIGIALLAGGAALLMSRRSSAAPRPVPVPSPDNVPEDAPDGARYPWNVQSRHTRALQERFNRWATDNGWELLEVDGVLGPKTCGAIDLANSQGANLPYPATCAGRKHEAPFPTGPAAP